MREEAYFEENIYEEFDYEGLHNRLGNAAQVVQSNLLFNAVRGGAIEEERRVDFAASAYVLIAVCEAVAKLVPEEERQRASSIVKGDICKLSQLAKEFSDILEGLQ